MKENSRKTMAIVIVLVVAILLSIYAVVKAMKNGHQFATEEVSQKANEQKDEMMADATIKEEELTNDERIEKMKKLSESWDSNKVQTVEVQLDNKESDKKMKIPVPVGYTASNLEGENTVDGGLVIYEGTNEVTDTNKDEAQKNRNQWVWVPVYDVNDMYGKDANGKMWGKLYNFSSDGRTNDNWSEQDGKMTISNKNNDREPDLLSNYDKDDYLSRYLSETDKEQLSKELKDTFEKTIESIEKYGGFYIGRYETGGLDGTAKVVKGDTNISSQTWYTMYEKCKDLKGKNRNVETSMIWGCEWDRTLQWLVDTSLDKTKAYKDVGSNSSSWGNYTSSKKETGSTETYKRNNIYDMAGNVYDWTLEAFSTYSRKVRGGYYVGYRGTNLAGYRDGYSPYDGGGIIGCRASLYVEL